MIECNPKNPPDPPMDLGDMRNLGVRRLAVHCVSAECRHEAVFSADDYSNEVDFVVPVALYRTPVPAALNASAKRLILSFLLLQSPQTLVINRQPGG
jgi:hypothetical protein